MIQYLYDAVSGWIHERSRVLDLGTGDGAFLKKLVEARDVEAEGVELDGALASRCVERGLVVYQGDILEGLDQYGSDRFDYVLLLGTLQELVSPWSVMREAFRVGRRVIVAYANFGHWRVRLQVMTRGRTPITRSMPYPWYLSPNLQYFSVFDFGDFCREMKLVQVETAYFNSSGPVKMLPNLRAEQAVVMLENPQAR